MTREEVTTKLKNFICTELLQNPEYPLTEEEPLFSSGAIDSFAMAQVGVFIEIEFDVFIPDPDLTVDSMDTLKQMVDRVGQDLEF